MKVIQHLWFEKDMEAAVDLYCSLIPGSTIEWRSALPAETPFAPAGDVKMIGFTLGDQRYNAFEAPVLEPFNHAFSITLECDTQEEVDRYWSALSEGGKIEQCGWLRDRWGLCWQITPKRLGEMINDPDRAKARRAAEAMLKMVKLDIAALEAAARGDGA